MNSDHPATPRIHPTRADMREVCLAVPDAEVRLFGSHARGEARPSSD
jgi:predicted nucleotidyltransferase